MSQPGGGIRLRTDRLGLGVPGLESHGRRCGCWGLARGNESLKRMEGTGGRWELEVPALTRGTEKEPIFCLLLEDLIEQRSHWRKGTFQCKEEPWSTVVWGAAVSVG